MTFADVIGVMSCHCDSLHFSLLYTPIPAASQANIDIHKLTFSDATSAQWVQLAANPTEGNNYNPFVPHGRAYAASAVVTADRIAIYGGCLRYCVLKHS